MSAFTPYASPDLHLHLFEGIPAYTRDEVALWNWFCATVPGAPSWQTWILEALGEFLERPAGFEVRLKQKHTVQPSEPERAHALRKPEILIGREEDSDIILPQRSVGKRHARIFVQDGECFLEDLGSALGTYVNGSRLPSNQPRQLNTGDQLAVFPYLFEVALEQLWKRENQVEVQGDRVVPLTWRTFLDSAPLDSTNSVIMIQPGGAVACLEAGRFFLADFLSRLLQPLGVPRGEAGLVPSDAGLFEFLIACLLERANRDLAFPFQFEAGPCGARPGYLPETRGLSLAFSVRLLGLTGAFRLFMPFELVGLFRDRAPRVDQPPVGSPVSWPFPLSAGHVDLTYEEMFGLEPHDVVLFESEPMLLVPGAWDCGWKLSPDGGNACRYGVDKYVRGEHLDESQPMPAEQPVTRTLPDLGRLPVRLNVVLGEKELTFAQANGLVSGSIIELERGKADPVDLAINGKVVGTGQLVEVEGRLGVKILAWRGAA